ncbi:MAG TPA: DUF2171 domain-containing protein [Candidatus Limnocylindrales bacterium]|jgi:hypothetical protein|nr:DUF2171 domain-containing protein [Candidatus Limnocylindrales bacterium]
MVEAQQIKEHMEVCGSDGAHIGTVDCTKDSNKIVLTKSDPKSGGQHHIIPLDWVEKIDDKVRLKKSAKDAITQWQTAA